MTLILNGTDNSATTPAVTGTDTDTGIYYPTSNQVAIATNGTQAMLVDASQNVGIGTASPAAPLHVGPTGTGAINGYTKFIVNSTDYAVTTLKSPAANFSQIIFTDPTSTNLGGINFFNSSYATPNAMAFLTGGGNERLRIDANGNLGIGTTTPVRKLTVSSAGSCEFVLQDTSQAANSRNWRLFNTSNTLYFGTLNDAGTAGTDVMKLTSGANLQFNSGYGSVATAYGCRAWCQYNQSATIVGAGNITSITVLGTGDVRLNFATAMVDSNYSAVATTNESGGQPKWCNSTQPSTTDIRIVTFNASQSTGWFEYNSVAVFR
jgi:hypothetical protein